MLSRSFLVALAACLFFSRPTLAEEDRFFPSSPGLTWEYEVSDSTASAPQPEITTVRIAGPEQLDGRELLNLETIAAGEIKSELIAVGDRGVLCFRRSWSEEKKLTFNPPQPLVPLPLQVGTKWESDDVIDGTQTRQQFSVASEEEVTIPAGTFRAYRFHAETPWPLSTTIDRWFVPGVGFIKEVTTTRGPNGRLVHRVTSVLRKFGHAAEPPPPAPTPPPTPPTIILEVAKEREGEPVTQFQSDVPNIFVRWRGENLPLKAEVRVVWIAEDVGDVADPNFVVDETFTTVEQATSAARFTLSRPKDGWAAGKYRAELYLNDDLLQSVSVTIRD